MRKTLFFFFSSFIFNQGISQIVYELPEPDNIKTVKFFGSKITDNFPVVKLGEKITLVFDDLNGNENDYYYKIEHFNHDWRTSNLLKNEYLNGYDNVRIDNHINSFNTLQSYTHYRLEIPNKNVSLIISGNYLIKVFDSYDELIFSRRFCVYEELASVRSSVNRPQNMDRFNTHQSIHFSITPLKGTFRNPEKNLFVHLIQNRQWYNQIQDLKPQYLSGSTLQYFYESPSQFEGGNEFYFFDSKDLRISTPNISYTNKSELYEIYLNIDIPRIYKNYSYSQDINGGFEIRNTMRPSNPDNEADYSYVYFSLASDRKISDGEIYVYGGFNNYKISDLNRMYFNPSLGIYEGIILLKQGFYNYKYVIREKEKIKQNGISGSHALTENDYLVLAYYRNIGAQYDSLIGVGECNSFNLQN